MSRRLLFCLVLTAAFWLPRAASAQAYPWSQSRGFLYAEPPASAVYGPGNALGVTTYPAYGTPPFSGQALWENDRVDGNAANLGDPRNLGYPDTYGQPMGSGPPGDWVGGYYGSPYRPAPGMAGGVAQTGLDTYEVLPRDRGWLYDEDIAHLRAAHAALRGMFVRTEYLNWWIQNPGNTLLGAPLANTVDPRKPFIVQADDGFGNLVQVGQARVMDMSPVDLRNVQGARVTFGVPIEEGEFDISLWGVQTIANLRAPELLLPPNATPTNPFANFIATSLLENGAPGTLLILYDRDFQAKYMVTNWGAEANFLQNLRDPADGFNVQGLVGFRYTGHREELIQRGSFDNSSFLDPFSPILDPPVNNYIGSFTQNHVYGLQLGLRTELSNRYYTIGVEPKVALGVNQYEAQVETRNLRDFDGVQDDGTRRTELRDSLFCPTFDVGFYARFHLTDWFSLNVGYNLIWMANIARADEVVRYNDEGLANPPAVVVKPFTESLWMQGISVGGQITFR